MTVPQESPPPPPGQLSPGQVRAILFADNSQVRQVFNTTFPALIERAVSAIALAHDHLDVFRARATSEEKVATLELFFHAAVNSVLCATHHLISGFPIAAGNMLRHHTEAIAMALLCLDSTSGVYERFSADRRRFPVHSAPTTLRQRKRRQALESMLAFDVKAWEKILELNDLYDQLSHASALSLAHQLLLNSPNAMILGGEYDPAKEDAYMKDLRRCASAAEALAQLLSVVNATLFPPAAT